MRRLVDRIAEIIGLRRSLSHSITEFAKSSDTTLSHIGFNYPSTCTSISVPIEVCVESSISCSSAVGSDGFSRFLVKFGVSPIYCI